MSRPVPTRCLALPDGRSLELQLRRSPRARNMLIRILEVEGQAELVLPRRVSLAEGWSFVEERAGWIDERLAELPPRVLFEHGAITLYRGAPLGLRRSVVKRGGRAVMRDGHLEVTGPAERFARAVRSWYVAEARRELSAQAHAIAASLDRTVKRITIRDPDTRWGSCSSSGHLSFSWRLMMAPPDVTAYVVTHEVAHLKAMHHGRSFWTLVERLYGDPAPARRWLNDNGLALRRHG